jgi:hypothetical protein
MLQFIIGRLQQDTEILVVMHFQRPLSGIGVIQRFTPHGGSLEEFNQLALVHSFHVDNLGFRVLGQVPVRNCLENHSLGLWCGRALGATPDDIVVLLHMVADVLPFDVTTAVIVFVLFTDIHDI